MPKKFCVDKQLKCILGFFQRFHVQASWQNVSNVCTDCPVMKSGLLITIHQSLWRVEEALHPWEFDLGVYNALYGTLWV
jgi:hypothetical protein